MTSKQFRKARVEAKIFHRGDAFEWFKKDCQTFDSLAARLSPFTTNASSRIKLYPIITK